MKKVIMLIALGVVLTINSIAQYNSPLEYMNAISDSYRGIQEDMWDYTKSVAHGKSARKVEKRRAELIQTTIQGKNKVERMPGYDGDTSYRDSVVSFLNIYYYILKEDYAKIVDMEEIAERSYDDMEAYMMAQDAASSKMNSASQMVGEQQKVFADKYEITLVEADDDLSNKIVISGEVYDYYNVIYLIFFKAYIQEKYLIEAINNSDVSGIEQNKTALLSASEEGLEKLKEIKPYNNDNSVVIACQELLEFYKDEAENKISVITDYHIKTENFNSIQTSFNEIKEKNRTQEDIDGYNKAVNEVNEASNAYNETNEQLGKDRADYLDSWNKSVAKFTDKHVPKGKIK